MIPNTIIVDLFAKLEGAPASTQEWVVRAVGHAVTADRIVHPAEAPFLMSLIQVIRGNPEIAHTLSDILHPGKEPELPPLALETELAEEVFQCVLLICASERDLHTKEFEFINHVGEALNLDPTSCHHFINVEVRRHLKGTFLKKLLRSLDKPGRYWVSVMVLKLIQADEKIDHEEAHYLKDVHDLLQKDSQRIEAAKNDALNKPLEAFSPLKVDKGVAKSILQYLLEILMGEDEEEVDQREMDLIVGIAPLLEVPPGELEKIIKAVESETSV